jgi:hypothetical protein
VKQILRASLAVVLISVIGCGQGEARLPTVKANGKLYVDDKPFGGCSLLLSPKRPEGTPAKDKPQPRSASATLAADGSFTLTTYKEGDGIIPGNKYDETAASKIRRPFQFNPKMPDSVPGPGVNRRISGGRYECRLPDADL